MAGAEKTGVAAARANLFLNAACVVTPTGKSNPTAVRRISQLWELVGCRLLKLAPAVHDDLVSRSSHLPHVVAAELANLVLNPGYPEAQPTLCANGFRDTTRIASGSPEMWRDIALANRQNLSRALTAFMTDLHKFQLALKNQDTAAIARFFEQAKQRRDEWARNARSHSPE
jgi:prephenate dehydrogenase